MTPADVLLFQCDGSFPNLALMRIAAHHRALGDSVELRKASARDVRHAWDSPKAVYASTVFENGRPLAELVLDNWPKAVVGGTGWAIESNLESHEIVTDELDYSVYPGFVRSLGFTQRGCRLRCPFCVVPKKEGKIRSVRSVSDIWRGEGHPRDLLLLDNDFFGQAKWRDRVKEIVDGKFRVCLTQGVNVRALTDEEAAALASMNLRSNKFDSRRIYTAWDNLKDEKHAVAGLRRLIGAGVTPSSIMVYMLVGFAKGETHADRDHRRKVLRDLGVDPYPMVYKSTAELRGFQRWVSKSFDKRISWEAFAANKWQVSRGRKANRTTQLPMFGAPVKRRLLVGNDPGKEGWIAWIDADTGKPVGCAAQPMIGKGKGDTYDRTGMKLLVRAIQAEGEIVFWAIELQQAAGGRASLSSFGVQMKSYGVWLGVLVALEVPHQEVTAQAWRKSLNVTQPRYPKEKALHKAASKVEKKAWATRDRKRIEKQRKEGLERAVRRAQQLYPRIDMRRNDRCRVPSPDKAIAHLLARLAGSLSGALPLVVEAAKKKVSCT